MLTVLLIVFTCQALEGADVSQEACTQNDTAPFDVTTYMQIQSGTAGNRRRRRRCGQIPLNHECPHGRNDCCANLDGQTVCGLVQWTDMFGKYYSCCNSWVTSKTKEGGTAAFCANPAGGSCRGPAECQSCPCTSQPWVVSCNFCGPEWGDFKLECKGPEGHKTCQHVD
eukprot:TRINITY_DN100026_c0_g1_i1.p1 TRINITY_DN100026_c0_g1~~TRINITY_DN100026_c0_g1_i1.p1  ORF type:complete len:169 (-),score=9.74 TRINITY_DN100026_c0_g1_i1:119-625(-)